MSPVSMSNSFHFNTFHSEKFKYTDNRNGSPAHYLAFMRRGRSRIVTPHYTVEIPEGSFFYIPLGVPYESYWYGSPDICFDSFAFLYFPEFELNDYPVQVIPHDDEILALVNALTGGRLKTVSQDVGTLYVLLGKALPRMQSNPANRAKQIIARAEEYLYENPDARNCQIARHCGISESSLYALFRQEGDLTPNALRQQILARKAAELLATTDFSVESISARLNFSSASYFRKVIKQHTGLTPREIRKQRLI